jgi:hypothetical protein
MTKSRKIPHKIATASVIVLLSAAAIAAESTPETQASPAVRSCFWVNQWHGWKSPDPDTIYLKVNMHDVYRIELSGGSPMLQAPDMHLVSIVRGSDMICSALDLQLSLSDQHGDMREPLIAKSLVKMTPEEVAAIPEKFRP